MAQLLVRNLPEEVKERLARRARLNGRSLEAEVRTILAGVPEPLSADDGAAAEKMVTDLIRRQQMIGITRHDIADLEATIDDLRRDQRIRPLDVAGE